MKDALLRELDHAKKEASQKHPGEILYFADVDYFRAGPGQQLEFVLKPQMGFVPYGFAAPESVQYAFEVLSFRIGLVHQLQRSVELWELTKHLHMQTVLIGVHLTVEMRNMRDEERECLFSVYGRALIPGEAE